MCQYKTITHDCHSMKSQANIQLMDIKESYFITLAKLLPYIPVRKKGIPWVVVHMGNW